MSQNSSQNIIITGANRGLGFGFVNYYLNAGHKVIACCRNPLRANELSELSLRFKNRLHIEELNLSNENSIKGLRQRIEQLNLKFDIVINNAGICEEEGLGNWTKKYFVKTFEVNTIGPVLFCQEIFPLIKEGGKLVNMSSGMGSITWNINPHEPLEAYAMSKTALNIFSARLAQKLRSRNIIVIALNPGWVKTEMGGEQAPDTVEQAINKMIKTIADLNIEASGKFLSQLGEEIPW